MPRREVVHTKTIVRVRRRYTLPVLADLADITAHPLPLPGRNATVLQAAGGVFLTRVAGVMALGKGSTDARQTEDTAKASSGDGFEGLTT